MQKNKAVVHFDLETGSLRPNAKIYSIGAILMDETGAILSRFSVRISPFCPENQKRLKDNDQWWLQNNPEEFKKITEADLSLEAGLSYFAVWCERAAQAAEFWQKRFQDFGWLESAYAQIGQPNPIPYTAVRELVTFAQAVEVESKPHTNAHNALADAIAQGELWAQAIKRLKEMKITYLDHRKQPFNPNFSHEDPSGVKILLMREGKITDVSHVVASLTDMEYLENPNVNIEALVLYADHMGLTLSEAMDNGFLEKYVGNSDSLFHLGPYLFLE